MKTRPAYTLSTVMKVYNLTNIVLNLCLFVIGLKATNYGIKCFQCGSDIDRFDQLTMVFGYYYLKIFDLLDTVFFVMRKKDRQVTRLHVVHHAVMPCLVWTAIKFYPYPAAMMTLVLNSFVHVVMYGYYYMASVPEYKTFLWWKKYITVVQLVQFMILFVQGMSMMRCAANNPLLQSIAWMCTCFLLYMIYSFSMFYYKSYVHAQPQKSDKLHSG